MFSQVVSFLAVFSAVWLVLGATQPPVYIGTGLEDRALGEILSGNDVIVLGGLFPVHSNEENNCGSVLDLGVQRLEAMVFATGMINRNTSLLPGITLVFEIRDTCTYSNYALEQSLEYVSARSLGRNGTVLGVSGVVGAASSGVSIAVANLLRLFHIPQISYASTAKILSDKTRFDYFFRTVPPDSLQAKAIADIISYFGWSYVIAIHSEDAYGSEGILAFVDELLRRNVNNTQACIATLIGLPLVASDMEYDAAVETIDSEWVRNSSVVVLFGQLETAIGVLRAVERRQLVDPEFSSRNLTWIGSDAWGDQLPVELHLVARGMLSVIPQAKQSRQFDDYFQSLNPLSNSANPWFDEYWEQFFNCSLRNNSHYEPCIISHQSISQETGYKQNSKVTFTIDAVYAFAHAIHKMQQDLCPSQRGLCSNMLSPEASTTNINGETLLEYLHNVTFSPGASADVIAFDESGDEKGGFLVKNLQLIDDFTNRHSFEVVGYWNTEGFTDLEILQEIKWSHHDDTIPQSICSYPCRGGEYPEPITDQADCCWICRPCLGDRLVSTGLSCSECELGYTPNSNKTECVEIPPTFLTWSSLWSIMILLATSAGIIATSVVALIFITCHKHQLIKASSRELSTVLLIGIMLCYLLPFFFIAQPSLIICTFRRFGVGFCFAVCYSALLVKTNRIHRIFNRNPGSIQAPPLISPQSQIFFTMLLVSVQVVIAVVWLVVERPGVTFVYGEDSTELKCGESPHIGLSVSLGYNLLLLIMSTYFAFRARKIPQNFNEAKFINLTLYTICIIWLAFIPTYFATASLGTVYQTSSLVFAINLSATTTLCCLFMPKVYFLISQMRKDHFSSNASQHAERHHSICSVTAGTSSLLAGSTMDRRRSSVFAYDISTSNNPSQRHRSKSTSSKRSSTTSVSGINTGSPRHFELPVVHEEKEKGSYSSLNLSMEDIDSKEETIMDGRNPLPAMNTVQNSSITTKEYCDAETQTISHSSDRSPPYVNKELLYKIIPLPPSASQTPSASYTSLDNY